MCSRDFLTRPPDWRYKAAVLYVEDKRKGLTPMIPTDPVTQYLIRGLTAGESMHTRRYLMQLWPDLDEVLYHGVTARDSAVTAELDTCMIKGWTYAQARLAGLPVNESVYRLYRSLFLDLSGIIAVHSWVHDFLFEPYRHGKDQRLLRAHLLAYYGGGKTGLHAGVLGFVDKPAVGLMKAIAEDQRMKQVFDYTVKQTHMDMVTYVNVMETAVRSMTDRDFQERLRNHEEEGSESLAELAQGVEDGVKAFTQSEMQDVDSAVDDSSQYIRIIQDTQNE